MSHRSSRRKRYARKACLSCCTAKRSCNDHRPCDRCVRLGKVCEDEPGVPASNDAPGAVGDGVAAFSLMATLQDADDVGSGRMRTSTGRYDRDDAELHHARGSLYSGAAWHNASSDTVDRSGGAFYDDEGGASEVEPTDVSEARSYSRSARSSGAHVMGSGARTQFEYPGARDRASSLSHAVAAPSGAAAMVAAGDDVDRLSVSSGDNDEDEDLYLMGRSGLNGTGRVARTQRLFNELLLPDTAAACYWAVGALHAHAALNHACALAEREMVHLAAETLVGGSPPAWRAASATLLDCCRQLDAAAADVWCQERNAWHAVQLMVGHASSLNSSALPDVAAPVASVTSAARNLSPAEIAAPLPPSEALVAEL